MNKYASLSIDLDNLWAYLKVYGDPKWKQYPSYFKIIVPRILSLLSRHNIKTTFFIVGQDASSSENADIMQKIAAEGHEFGNHSYDHEPWMEDRDQNEIVLELAKTHQAIIAATGKPPVGFRGPGFCCNQKILEAVHTLNYSFDASLFPTVISPIARLYYLFNTKPLNDTAKLQRKNLFGGIKNGFMPLKPFKWHLSGGELLEIPVTTIPLFRIPFHLSYIMWLSKFSKKGALNYFRFALWICKARGVEPSLLLHPLDFLGKDDVPELSFFPGMDLSSEHKLEIANTLLSTFSDQFKILTMSEHALLHNSQLKTIIHN